MGLSIKDLNYILGIEKRKQIIFDLDILLSAAEELERKKKKGIKVLRDRGNYLDTLI
jgi:hypothetical protein